ncbi:drebrin-like protein A [Salvelinus sp. IW2-2015]|uniref:drebrin-like protein A n=1 Tax=Salvelinus sp. IW2-2015 TaxID=2691554 RepID=UPI000CDF59B5|nr:drebrin-like protein B isoform X1 [Salvelinus alpinus]XP_023858747.1 drebrin-like protein B isoform X2 [Salvelinus alpinus]
MRAINLDTYSLSLLTAKEDILNPRSSTNWALFTYDGATNNLKLADSGAGGVVELSEKFLIARPQYGLCRVGSAEVGGPRVAMICWVGPNVDENRRTECASHVPAIKTFFKEAYVFISAESKEDVTEEKIGAELNKVRSPTEHVRRSSRSKDKETVGTNYRKTNAAMEMSRANRDSFWARAEREEERRKEEERKRAVEDRRRWEKERVLKEQKEADERERKMNEKLQMIEEQRRMQVQLEAEVRKQEKSRWELQEREHEEDMRSRFRRSESIEKAAEAAMLVSQRSMNPREFFRQLSSVSSRSPSSPGSPRTGKPPLRRYQRSLTDTAFNFGKSDSPIPTSPRSPTLVSPFSRFPTSPFHRTMSPPSPIFRPSTSSQSPRAPLVSPPKSALHSAPPVSAQATLPSPNPQFQLQTQPSALPASPGLLANVSPTSPLENQLQAQFLPHSPQSQPERFPYPLVSLKPVSAPQPPSASVPESPLQPTEQYTAIQVVLVEEDEDEEEDQAEPEPSIESTEPNPNMEKGGEGSAQDSDPTSVQEPMAEEGEEAKEAGQEKGQSDYSQVSAEPFLVELSEEEQEPAVTDAEVILQLITQKVVVPSTNGVTDEEELVEHNGTERSMSPPERDQGTPELAVCFDEEEEDFVEENEVQEISENGQEACVRALYDYQAEDESEISFEPGDIISAVETVDKAWWRGCTKDGRQGLFPANYVETI